MAKATMVFWEKEQYSVLDDIVLRTVDSRYTIFVDSLKDGVAKCSLSGPYSDFIEVIIGCFEKDSNFESTLWEAFGITDGICLFEIEFTFLHITITVNEKNCNLEQIKEQWDLHIEQANNKQRIQRAKVSKRNFRKKTVRKEICVIENTTAIQLKEGNAVEKWKKWNEDMYDSFWETFDEGIIRYSCYNAALYCARWAKYMQHIVRKHNTSVEVIAKQTWEMCNVEHLELPRRIYYQMVNILIECWIYGDELQNWFYNFGGNLLVFREFDDDENIG